MTQPPSPLTMLFSRHTRRREFISLLGGAATWPLAARAQQGLRQITVWMGRGNDAEGERHAAAFRETLRALGWADGRNVRTHYHWVTGDIDRARLAKEVVEQKPDLITAETTVAVAALALETRTIPIVFVNVSDPIGSGFVASLALAARHRVPAIYAYRYQVTGGGLISYGVDIASSFRAAASYVDRILKGEKAANLPVQAPTKFALVVNLKTAIALGLTVPTSILLRADEVIE
jgi:ABC-type uncharacterized transport system substrate-binding protein